MNELVNNISNIQFHQIEWLWLFALTLPILILICRLQRLHSLSFSPANQISHIYKHPQQALITRLMTVRHYDHENRANTTLIVHVAFLFCMHITLAQPYYPGQQLPVDSEYRDTLFIVDASINMSLRDYMIDNQRIERMTMMKTVLNVFFEKLKDNRIGVVAFSEQAYTLVPFSNDLNVLNQAVSRLKPAVLTGRSSNPGKALVHSLTLLQKNHNNEISPSLILITDVNRPDRDYNPLTIAAYMNSLGYQLNVIGIGASSYQATENLPGGLIYHPANIELLSSIAKVGGGHFYNADDVKGLRQAIEQIQQNEKRIVNQPPEYIRISIYHWPLLLAISMIILLQCYNLIRHKK